MATPRRAGAARPRRGRRRDPRAGRHQTCTITNDDLGPTLTLVKSVTNDNGGTKVIATSRRTPTAAWSPAARPTWSAPGLHMPTESTPVGYAPSSWGGPCAAGGAVTLAPGDTKTCTITNDDIGPPT